MNAGFLAEIKKKANGNSGNDSNANDNGNKPKPKAANLSLMAALKSRQQTQQQQQQPASAKNKFAESKGPPAAAAAAAAANEDHKRRTKKNTPFREQPFEYHPDETNSNNTNIDNCDDSDNDNDQAQNGHGFFLLVSDGETSEDFETHKESFSTSSMTSERDADGEIVPSTPSSHTETLVEVPLAPLVYRACDYTFEKAVRNQTPVKVDECVRKLGILRALQRERDSFNALLESRLARANPLEEEELGKTRFIELLSNGGVARKVVEMLLKEMTGTLDDMDRYSKNNHTSVLAVRINGLDELLATIEKAVPQLKTARQEIKTSHSVSFYPGLGELFCPGSKLVCYPEGMEGSPLGCSCVQSWYSEDYNQATGKTKKRFVLVIEFIVSVGDELVFVAMTDVYPEFHDTSRNVPLKDLSHRKLCDDSVEDAALLERLQLRGEFYASVATKNHFLEYYADSFFPILKGGGWSSNAVRPLSKGGRVMVDVKRGILEGHIAVRSGSSGSGSGDATSDTVKEAIKLFESSKRTGIAVPFRTCVLPEKFRNTKTKTASNKSSSSSSSSSSQRQQREKKDLSCAANTFNKASDRERLWMSWPMLVGFSFTARVWGKLLLGMPKKQIETKNTTTAITTTPLAKLNDNDNDNPCTSTETETETPLVSPRRGLVAQQRPSSRKFGVEIAALGGEGRSGNCGYISFQTQAFDQLVLAEDKKELIRAVARNAGGGGFHDDESDDDDSDDDDFEDVGIDVVANKGGASIFLLHGPPGCGKTLTAEAIAELLEKPLYIVTAGDLGISASEVEKNLGSVLELCQTWDALVLIDEADVFLEARNSTEIARNALVCVMLRLLEYYSGCLFLSSNRSAGSIDAAIASRITVMLSYPKLDATGRGKVWKNLIELLPVIPTDPLTGKASEKILSKPRKASKYRIDFSVSDYQELAERFQLNGRQIKNSIVLARALARERRTPLNLSVLHRAVIAVAGEDVTNSGSITDDKSGY